MPQKEKAQAARRWFGSCQLAPKALACILKLCTLFENPKILVERARWYFILKLDKAVEGRVKKGGFGRGGMEAVDHKSPK